MIWQPILLSMKLAFVTTAVLMIIGIPLAYIMSKSRSRLKPVFESVVSLPLVLPPTVIGFYFLLTFGKTSLIGEWLHSTLGLELVFSFEGLVVASVIYSLPFMVHPIQSGFRNLPAGLEESAWVLGKSRMETIWKVLLPNIKSSLLTGFVLSFAHTIGEFGVVLMIGGSLPGKTEVASIAIYKEVESMNYANANFYSLVLLLFTFTVLMVVYAQNRKTDKVYWK